MNVPNHEKKEFKDMTPEERSTIVEASLAGRAEFFSIGEGVWLVKMEYSSISPRGTYRTRPRQLVIPWEHIKPEYKWAAMDKNGCIYFFTNQPEIERAAWFGGKSCISVLLNIDTTGIDWRESLEQRPE